MAMALRSSKLAMTMKAMTFQVLPDRFPPPSGFGSKSMQYVYTRPYGIASAIGPYLTLETTVVGMGTREVIAAGSAFGLATNAQSDLPFRVRELARMRIAQLNGCGL